jgi:hypothetical protein
MTPSHRKQDVLNWAGLGLVCAFFLIARWKKMGSLLWLDPARWLNEFSRVAHGEMPYRDFSFQYPPFAAFFYGWLIRWLGITFTNVQIITDLLDLVIIVLCFLLIRRLLPGALHLAAGALLVAVCSTSLMNFNFFSYVSYIPSLQTGAVGALLLLLGLLRYLEERRFAWAMVASGGFIAVLSKPEYALAAVCAVGLMAWIERDLRLGLKLGLAAIGPALLGYAVVAKLCGISNMRAGIGGYGLATAFCPWWPTGVGVFGILAALGEAVLVGSLLVLGYRATQTTAPSGRGSVRQASWPVALIAGIVYLAYIAYQNKGALLEAGLPFAERARRIFPSFVYTSAVLQPVMWAAIMAFLVCGWRLIKHGDRSPRNSALLLILLWPVVMSTRSLFGSTQNIFPEVTAVDYPFLLILAPYFLWRYLKSATTPGYALAATATLVIGYSLVRVAGGWSDLLSDRKYGVLDTPAGSVKLLNYGTDSQVYRYVMAHTAPGDYLLDIPYGGGLNFATGHPSPIFTTQLAGMGWTPEFQQRDLNLFQRHPPRLIVAQDEPNLGTFWGFGQRGDRACTCPRLVWAPGAASWDAQYVFPLVEYIGKYYEIRARFGDKILLEPKS